MDVTIRVLDFTLRFRIEILILIMIVSFILVSHLCCSCTTVSPMEAFQVAKKVKEVVVEKLQNRLKK